MVMQWRSLETWLAMEIEGYFAMEIGAWEWLAIEVESLGVARNGYRETFSHLRRRKMALQWRSCGIWFCTLYPGGVMRTVVRATV